VYRTHLNWLVLVVPILFATALMVPLAWFLSTGTLSHFAWIPVVVGSLAVIFAMIRRQSSEFSVTNKRVLMKVGVISSHSIELMLNKIEAITVDQSFLGRLLGYGEVILTGSGGSKEVFSNIQSPLGFRSAVQAVTDAQSTSAGRQVPPNP
jgi:uncharacterized membrane protein YdbT with pleckstrin-like domain